MKKLFTVFALSLLSSWNISAQEARKFCYTTQMEQEAVRNNPDLLRTQHELDGFVKNYIRHAQTERRNSGVVYIIPLVFHIVHNYGNENISDATVQEAVDILNRDYRMLNADTVNVIPVFKPLVADAEIEFRLANLDLNGNCTNGIERIVSTRTYNADDLSKLHPWPNNKYLNIWVVNSLANQSAAAYAYRPGNIPSAAVDGVIARYDYIGASSSGPRTLTHEIGHCLGLKHPWGANNDPGQTCGDDGIADTPVTMGWTSCVLNGSICNPPIIENVQNYMDYSYCDCMFTINQVQFMRGVLNSATDGRNNLWTSGNLTATGTDGSPIQICSPTADFYSNYRTICANTYLTFSDLSWNAHPTSWSWSFPGGVPSSSTDSAPVVQYPTPGLYVVTLSVSNGIGSDSIGKIDFVRVSGPAVDTIPFYESFETPASFPGTDGYVQNPDNGQTWTRYTAAGSAGTASLRINNYTNTVAAVDQWISSSMDFSNITQPVLTFKYANARRNSTSNDQLKLYGSSNCGKTWTVRWSAGGASLTTAGILSTSYIPTNASQWSQQTVTMNSFQLRPNVRIMFENISDRGNNTYIDEINITGNIVSVDEISELELGFALYPNPSAGNSTIQFKLSKEQKVTVDVKNILGQTVSQLVNESLASGLHEYSFSTRTPGLYLVDLKVNGNHHVRKLIISEN